MAATDTPVREHVRPLAVALGVVRGTLAPLPLPPLDARPVPGGSPLEASGWACAHDAAAQGPAARP